MLTSKRYQNFLKNRLKEELEANKGNVKATAAALFASRQSIYTWMKKYNINLARYRK